MTKNPCIGVTAAQFSEHVQQRGKLPIGEVVFRCSFGIDTADQAHANRAGVVAFYMGACLRLGSAAFDRAVASNDIVIAHRCEAPLLMPLGDFGYADIAAGIGRRAMHHDEIGAGTVWNWGGYCVGFYAAYVLLPCNRVSLALNRKSRIRSTLECYKRSHDYPVNRSALVKSPIGG